MGKNKTREEPSFIWRLSSGEAKAPDSFVISGDNIPLKSNLYDNDEDIGREIHIGCKLLRSWWQNWVGVSDDHDEYICNDDDGHIWHDDGDPVSDDHDDYICDDDDG